MAVADKENSFIISGTGDVLEPEGDAYNCYRIGRQLRFSGSKSFD